MEVGRCPRVSVFDQVCTKPNKWIRWFWGAHVGINPEDLNAVYEFQGGAFDGWLAHILLFNDQV
jgi:hypothetical protein